MASKCKKGHVYIQLNKRIQYSFFSPSLLLSPKRPTDENNNKNNKKANAKRDRYINQMLA